MKRPMVMVLSFLSILFCLHISGTPRAHAACPDLSFDLTGPPAAAPGEMIGTLLLANIHNKGDMDSGALDVKFYFSMDSTITAANSIPIGEADVVNGVPVGTTLSVAIPPSMMIPPETTPGQYHIFMVVDEPSPPAGCTRSSGIVPILVTVPDQCPDLFMDITGPGIAAPGEEIGSRMTAAVNNLGNMDSQGFNVRFYLSKDTFVTAADSWLIGESWVESGVSFGTSVFVEMGTMIIIPPDIPPDRYNIVAVADEANHIFECDENNNTHALPITVVGGCPDLVVDLTGPGIAEPAQEIGDKVRTTIRNQGAADAGTFSVGFYLSVDAFIDTSDILLTGGREFVTGVPPGGELDLPINPFMQLPSGLPPGPYFLGVIVDESSEINECDEDNNFHSIPISIGGSCPDLTVDLERSDPTAPLVAIPGQEIGSLFAPSVKNQGDSDAGAFTVGFYLSKDGLITSPDSFFVGERSVDNGLPPGSTLFVDVSFGLTLPADIPPGQYLLLMIAHGLNNVEECDINNNSHAVPITIQGSCPNLAVNLAGPFETDPSTPFTAAPGQVIGNLLTAFVRNQGNQDAGAFAVGFYLSPDSFISRSDILLVDGRETEPGLLAGNTIEVDSPTLQIPEGISPGDYFLGVFVDEQDVIGECEENNNIGIIPIHIEEAECSAPDLWTEINEFSFDRQGSIVSSRVILTIFNQGQSPAVDFSAGAYISDDERIDQFDFFLPGSRNSVPELPPGESITLLLDSTFELPPDEPLHAMGFLGVMVDESGGVDECDEFNNSETAPLCESPLITPELRLLLPWVISRTMEDPSPIWMEMELVPWKESAAFELKTSDVNPPGKGSGLCGEVILTAEGFIHIPYIRFTKRGIVALAADLQHVPVAGRTLFEIVDLEILP